MDPEPRVLVLGTPPSLGERWREHAQLLSADDAPLIAEMLRSGLFTGLVLDATTALRQFSQFARDEIVLGHVDQGLGLLDLQGSVLWANPQLQRLCTANPIGRQLLEAMGSPTLAAHSVDPLAQAREGQPVSFRASWPASSSHPHMDLNVRPVLDSAGSVRQFVVLTRNVSAEVEQQRKLDALHQAGRELSGLDPGFLSEMNYPTRVELLKQNLRRSIHDLLHYDIIELRLLDRRTGELKPLLEDGMTPEAARRVLFASETGNGVTGYVAATSKSYLCPDTASDPLYIQGATEARSSMTVPLVYNDEVVGTLNVESPRPAGFGPDDLQFTELFSKEVAEALHTLELLTAQEVCTAEQSLEAVNCEVVLPIDEVLTAAALLRERLGNEDPEASALLHRLMAGARGVKENLRRVAADITPTPTNNRETPPLKGKRILVVDPDERTRRLAHSLLNRLGAEAETVGTANEGLALLADTSYDAVFLDNKPPDMGGYEAYRRFRSTRPQAAIALTTGFGYDSSHSIVKARQDGLQHLLFKPFRQDQVLRAVLGMPAVASAPVAVSLNGAI